MKKIYLLLTAAILSVVAISCSKTNETYDDTIIPGDQENPENPGGGQAGSTGSITMVANVEDAVATRTAIGDADADGNREVSWVVNDEVKVLYSGGSTTANADASGASAKFSFDAPDGDVWFTYPSSTGALDNGVLSVTIPAEQDGTFANNSYLVAKGNTEVEGVKFFNACSMFKIVVSDATLKKAVITGNGGEALAGTVSYRWDGANNEAPTMTVTSEMATSLTVTFSGTGTYYVAALPELSLTTGVTIKFYKEGETQGTYDLPAGGNATSSALTVARAGIASFGDSDAICHRYVSASGSGSDNGRTAAKAWNTAQFVNFLGGKWNGTATDAAKLNAMNGVTVHIDGTLTMPNADINLGNTFTRLNIVGATGAVFQGNGTQPIIHQNRSDRAGTTIEISNIEFTGGRRSGDHGGAIYQSYGKIVYKNCTFSDNQALTGAKNGGALHFYTSPTAVFEDCTFTENVAAGNDANKISNGGVMNITGAANLTFTRCHFYKNSATQDGGVACVNSKTSVVRFEDCDFGDGTDENQNSATNFGGVFYIEKSQSLYIVGCRFNNNTAKGGGALVFPSYAGDSGNITANSVHVQGCSFTNHKATEHGGVIRMVAGTLNLEKNGNTPCTFSNNTTAADKSGGVGYLIDGTINDNGSVYTKNYAQYGGVYVTNTGSSVLNCTSCIFGTDGVVADKNYAINGGGVYNQNGGTATFTKCEFYGNEAQTRPGGAIRRSTDGTDENVSITINGCIFKGNSTAWTGTGSGGGAIYFQKGTLTVQKADDGTRNSFINNVSLYRGGAICVDGTATAKISESDFSGNYTSGDNNYQLAGGALAVDGTTTDVEVTDCSFVGNHANTVGYGGGAVGTIGRGETTMKLKLNKCLFKDNYARIAGAIVNYSNGATIYMNACAFSGNYITNNYGCVINLPDNSGKVDNATQPSTATLCMNNCSFADNQHSGNGNGQQSCWVNLKGLTKVVMSNCSLIGRTRKESGTADDTNPNLLRFDGTFSGANYLINNIIAMTPTSGTFYSSDMKSSTVTGYYNKISAVLNSGNYTPGTGSASNFKGTSSYFGGLGSSMTEGNPAKWDNCYWSWNGTLATGGDLTKAALTDVNSTIQTADAGFYSWLNSIGALDKDCRGKTRGATTWPGAYDGTNN
ncbi:MAG: hypothetical protein J5702_00520 [Bacteroidales bacterium]|nr:hypothetical protein [Bacteroidales bacterium]